MLHIVGVVQRIQKDMHAEFSAKSRGPHQEPQRVQADVAYSSHREAYAAGHHKGNHYASKADLERLCIWPRTSRDCAADPTSGHGDRDAPTQ